MHLIGWKKENRKWKNRVFSFFGVVENRVGKFFQGPKTILSNLEKKWAKNNWEGWKKRKFSLLLV